MRTKNRKKCMYYFTPVESCILLEKKDFVFQKTILNSKTALIERPNSFSL